MRTWLIVGGVAIVALGLRIVLGRWFSKHRKRRMTRDRLSDFKSTAVALNEYLDALRNRHRALPVKDPDFSNGMQGLTLDRYAQIETAIGRHRAEWLEMMDAWDRVQDMLEEKSSWTVDDDNTARKELEAFDGADLRIRIERECEAPLDSLADAHSNAGARLGELEAAFEELRSQIDQMAAKELPTSPYQDSLQAAELAITRLRPVIPSDPVGMLASAEDVSDDIESLGRWTERILHHHSGLDELQAEVDAIRHLIAERRSSGFLYSEAGADPEPGLDAALAVTPAIRQAIENGEDHTAGQLLEDAFGHTERAEQLIHLQDRVRAECDQRLQQHQQRLAQLQARLTETRVIEADLQNEFAPSMWSDVGQHPDMAEQLLQQTEPIFAEIRKAASPDVQHYLGALQRLEELSQVEDEIATILDEFAAKRESLRQDRTEVRGILEQMTRRADEQERTLNRSGEDRAEANRLYHQARQRLVEVEKASLHPATAWERLRLRLETVSEDLTRSEELAREDFRLARQARQEISRAERAIRKTRSFYRNGVTADVSDALDTLSQAQKQLDSLQYEESMKTSRLASEEARKAHEHAIGRMEEREVTLEQERQKRVAEQISEIRVAPILSTAASIAGEVIRNEVLGSNKKRNWSRKKTESRWQE